MKRLVTLASFAIFLAGRIAAAQEAGTAQEPAGVVTASSATNDGRLLTFEEALTTARKNNRAIKVSRAQLAAAQTATETAYASLLPTINAQGKYTRNYVQVAFPPGAFGPKGLLLQPLDQWDGAVNGTLPLIAPAAWAALRSVQANVDAAQANFEAQEAQLLVQVAQTFLAAAGTDELVEARRSSLIVARATLKDAEVRLAAGSVTKVDVDRAEVAVVRAEQAEREAINARERTYRSLATLMQAQNFGKVSTNFPTSPMPDANDVQGALHLRPEFRALEETVRSAEQESNARAWLWAPSLSAFGNARRFNYDNFHLDRYSWAVGAQLDWQLFDGGNRDAARHQANARAAATREQAAGFSDTVRDDLANTSADLRTKRQAVEAAQKSVSLSQESLELIRTQYTAGTATQLDLLQAQDVLVGANIALVQAHFDVAAADLAFRYAAGTFPPK